VCCTCIAATFISAVGVSFIDLYTTSEQESICTPVISKRRLYNQDDQNMELIKILSEVEEGTELIMPWGATLKDEFENMYRIEGPYILKCDEMHEFNYVTERKVWHASHCCGWPDILNKWQNPTGKMEYKVNPGCGPCKEWYVDGVFGDTLCHISAINTHSN
jgi:hypothetical protein